MKEEANDHKKRISNLQDEQKQIKESIDAANTSLESLKKGIEHKQDLIKVSDEKLSSLAKKAEKMAETLNSQKNAAKETENKLNTLKKRYEEAKGNAKTACDNSKVEFNDLKEKVVPNIKTNLEEQKKNDKELMQRAIEHYKDALYPTVILNFPSSSGGSDGVSLAMNLSATSPLESLKLFQESLVSGDIKEVLSKMAPKSISFSNTFHDKASLQKALEFALVKQQYECIQISSKEFDLDVLNYLKALEIPSSSRKPLLLVSKNGKLTEEEIAKTFDMKDSSFELRLIDE